MTSESRGSKHGGPPRGAGRRMPNTSAPGSKAIAQYTVDAQLHAEFEQSGGSGKPFDYSHSLRATHSPSSSINENNITAYLTKIQRGGHVQPFGCMVAVDSAFKIIAFSENAGEFLGLNPRPALLGIDVRSLFTPPSSQLLERAFRAKEIALMNPIWICSKHSGKPFYGISHRIDVGIVLDLEPARNEDPALSIVGAVQSQKLAVRAISKLQSLPSGDVQLLCDTVVECVRELVAYDRVMVYKFHKDEHGEVVSECRRPDLESYLGLHYPATDIPQASRFLFKQSRVRMIVDCSATPVRVVQDEALHRPLCLVGSTLRSPHGCHASYMANMGSVASLAMAVIINDDVGNSSNNTMRLWGLVVCHHTSARCLPFPLRYACEFLMQAFGLQLKMELQLAAQMAEKHVLKTQTLLCDMILRGSPTGIVTRSPNIMDIVKCDGAALYYRGKYHPLGATPSELQVKDIMQWLADNQKDSTGLATDSLSEANYHGASVLGDAVCGMAVAAISSTDYLFWFRSHTAKQVKWGGAKHHPDDKDDGLRMHPRSSFKAFLEVVKSRSLPWESAEIKTIHSLQLILRKSFHDMGTRKANPVPRNSLETHGVDELSSVTREMVRLIETATAPIFAVDVEGRVNGWNEKIASLTGLLEEEAIGKLFVKDVIFEDCKEAADNMIVKALRGEEERNVELKLKAFGSGEAVYVVVNACSSKDYLNTIVGVCFVGQDVTKQKVAMDKFMKIQDDYKAIVHSPSHLIPPIFACDDNTCCVEWNAAMEKLTSLSREEAVGKTLVGEVFGNLCCFSGPDSLTKFMIVLHSAIGGDETDRFPFSFYDRRGNLIETVLTASQRVDCEGKRIGAFCFLHVSPEMQEKRSLTKMELSYLCQQLRNPLNGIRFSNCLLEATDLSDDKKQLLLKSASCEQQLLKIVDSICMEAIENVSLELEKTEFLLGNAIDAIATQVAVPLKERNLRLVLNVSEETENVVLVGDQARVQQVIVEYLLNIARHANITQDWVEMDVKTVVKQHSLIKTEFRLIWPGEGLPSEVVRDMLSGIQADIGLAICRKLLELMKGEVRYIIESGRCCFLILLVHPLANEKMVE